MAFVPLKSQYTSTKILGGVDKPCLRFEIATKDFNPGCLNSVHVQIHCTTLCHMRCSVSEGKIMGEVVGSTE